jgi:Dyp-type peroxidase family
VFYEQIEPAAEVFGDLDTQIDGRWQNPVTVRSQFMGFHRLEQILWDEPSMTGATALCQGLMEHEEKLVALVAVARYSPQEMAAGGQPVIPADSHIRLASHEHNAGTRILRRGYSFTDGIVPETGTLDGGLFFIAYMRDPAQFVRLQQPLAGDALNEYIRHVSSAVFVCPPGLRPGQDWGGVLFG